MAKINRPTECCPKPIHIKQALGLFPKGDSETPSVGDFELLDSGDFELLDSGDKELLD